MAEIVVYQLRIYLRKISPLIWRRLLVRSDSSVADLHYALQIVMNWTDYYLHQFRIRGKRYGVARLEGPWFSERAEDVLLNRFHFRPRERFLYEYNFIDQWEHEIRVEQSLPFDAKKRYPFCIGGANAAPPEDCGGPERFLALKHRYNEGYILHRLWEMVDENGLIGDYREEITAFQYWTAVGKYDRRAANKRLQLYAAGNDEWRYG